MTTQTTVVTKQVSGGTTITTGNRDWNANLYGCGEDCGTTMCVLCCTLCFAGKLSQRLGEHCCMPCCVPGGIITMRTKLRLMLGIQGSICNDCITMSCCGLCALCQMSRELDMANWPQ